MLLYDADCGFCTRAAAWAPRLRLTVTVRALQSVDPTSLGIDPERAAREIPLVESGGRVRYGADAIAAALTTGPPAWRTIGTAMTHRPIDRLAAWVYRLVARSRYRLPGGGPACRIDAPPTRPAG